MACALMALAALAIGLRRLSFVSLLLVGFVFALAFLARRHTAFFAIGVAFLLGDFAAGLEPGRRARTAIAVSLVVALLCANGFAAFHYGFENRRLTQDPSEWIGARGLEFIRAHVQGNVLNAYHLGGILIYFGHPRIRVAIDPRGDPYPVTYYQSYRNAIYGDPYATRGFVERHAIDHIIVSRWVYEHVLRAKLPALWDFRLVYADEIIAVVSRPRSGTTERVPPGIGMM